MRGSLDSAFLFKSLKVSLKAQYINPKLVKVLNHQSIGVSRNISADSSTKVSMKTLHLQTILVDIEAVDAVAAVVVKEVIVPLANKKSKTVITLPFNFHLISELFYHLEQKTLSHHYSSLKIGLHHQK